MLQATVAEGSLIYSHLGKFLDRLKSLLIADPEEMDWELVGEKELVTMSSPTRERWRNVSPEVVGGFDR